MEGGQFYKMFVDTLLAFSSIRQKYAFYYKHPHEPDLSDFLETLNLLKLCTNMDVYMPMYVYSCR